jgi:hypothetical protein
MSMQTGHVTISLQLSMYCTFTRRASCLFFSQAAATRGVRQLEMPHWRGRAGFGRRHGACQTNSRSHTESAKAVCSCVLAFADVFLSTEF